MLEKRKIQYLDERHPKWWLERASLEERAELNRAKTVSEFVKIRNKNQGQNR